MGVGSGHGKGASTHSIPNTAWPKLLAVATSAIDFTVRSIVQVGGVQGTVALCAAEATTMPYLKW